MTHEVEEPSTIRALSGRLRRTLRRYPIHLQPDLSDCGPACLGMVAEYHGRKVGLARLRELCRVSREGCSLYALAEAAEALGLRARAVEATFDDLEAIDLPAIAHVGTNHFVVVYAVRGRHVIVGNPASGIERIGRDAFTRDWQGVLLLLTPTARPLGAEDGATPGFGRFLSYLRPHRTTLVEVFLAAIVLHLLGLVLPLATQVVIDRVLVHGEVSFLVMLLMAAVSAALFGSVIGAFRALLLYDAVRAADRVLMADFHDRLFRLPMRFFAARKVGDLLIRFSDNQRVREFLVTVFFGTGLDLVFGVIYLALVFAYDARLALVGVIPVPLLLVIGAVFTPGLRRVRRDLVHRYGENQSALVETLSGVSTVKALRAEAHERRRFERLFDRLLAAEQRGVRLQTLSITAAGFVVATGQALVLYYGALLVLERSLTVGALVAASALLSQVTAPALRLVGVWEQFQEVAVSMERLADVFDARPEEPEGGGFLDLPPIEGHVKFEDVTFRYERDLEPALASVTFEVPPGERVAVVGRSGAGKTTLASLLLKLYEPEDGSIAVDGHQVKTVTTRSLRSQVGFVPQRVDIFSGTVAENIACGRDLAPAEIVEAARLAGAHAFIARLAAGYDTLVGERGTARFSSGELQRIAVARALAGRPRVLLMDEPTAALDAEGEMALLRTLEEVFAGRTMIVLTHRLAFARRADRILVFDRGQLVEQGTHAELARKGGLYATLCLEQTV